MQQVKKLHKYKLSICWTGNKGTGTQTYKNYERAHVLSTEGKPIIELSSDSDFRGDKSKYNPEELFVASISSCHMLWYLHLCAVNGIRVTAYTDRATGKMEEYEDGSGKFVEVTLNPLVTITMGKMEERARALHAEANKMCFIANSVNFKITHQPRIIVS